MGRLAGGAAVALLPTRVSGELSEGWWMTALTARAGRQTGSNPLPASLTAPNPSPGLGPPLAAGKVVGLDIGCGANLIYPLLGAALYGWSFVAVDVTDVAVEWAQRNKDANPQVAHLIDIRRVAMQPEQQRVHAVGAAAAVVEGAAGAAAAVASAGGAAGGKNGRMEAGKQGAAACGVVLGGPWGAEQAGAAAVVQVTAVGRGDAALLGAGGAVSGGGASPQAAAPSTAPQPAAASSTLPQRAGEAGGAWAGSSAAGAGIISSAIRHGERLAFCMCNPPFFESIEEAGRNPSTAFGGTAEEMVYPGGGGWGSVGGWGWGRVVARVRGEWWLGLGENGVLGFGYRRAHV